MRTAEWKAQKQVVADRRADAQAIIDAAKRERRFLTADEHIRIQAALREMRAARGLVAIGALRKRYSHSRRHAADVKTGRNQNAAALFQARRRGV